jgi:hypothetical protein
MSFAQGDHFCFIQSSALTPLERFKLVAVIGSRVESFFSQVEVNTVLIVAERRRDEKKDPSEIIRFVALKRTLNEILEPKAQGYWRRVRYLSTLSS